MKTVLALVLLTAIVIAMLPSGCHVEINGTDYRVRLRAPSFERNPE